ncbi:MAG: Peptidoglycan-binding LysM [Frankiales bacterium]|nr:Peptidoglycan-binding LysM [Frankiales bacterium]
MPRSTPTTRPTPNDRPTPSARGAGPGRRTAAGRSRSVLRRSSAALRAVAVVAVLAAVVTAGAPSFIRIRSGDTLSEIAQRHGTTVAALRALNGLPGNATIYAGERLRVPGASRSSSSTRIVERGYTVRSGDTLSGIAKRYGVTAETIRRRNRLSGPLQVGRRLAIPVRVSGSSGASSSGSSAGSSNVPSSVSRSAAANRALLKRAKVPSRATVRKLVAKTARRHGVSPSLALAVAYHESGFQQRVVSGVNAIGVMQVLPSTAKVLSQQSGRRLNILRAEDNITAGVLLLHQLLRSTGTERMALAGYYQGLGSIARQGLLPQTHSYIKSIGYLRPRFLHG